MLFAKSTLGTLKNLKIRMHPFKIFLVENFKKCYQKPLSSGEMASLPSLPSRIVVSRARMNLASETLCFVGYRIVKIAI